MKGEEDIGASSELTFLEDAQGDLVRELDHEKYFNDLVFNCWTVPRSEGSSVEINLTNFFKMVDFLQYDYASDI